MAPKAFLTNQKNKDLTLRKRLRELIGHSEELKFLVGFFYFSGWQELFNSIKEHEQVSIKILVGLQVDSVMGQLVEVGVDQTNMTDREIADKLIESFGKAINAEEFDQEQFYNQITLFTELIKNDRLEIRKTRDPNHAKLYLFNINEQFRTLIEKAFITGSSNLTRAGIHEQNEFNLELSDFGTEEAENYFDDLWDRSVKITENDVLKEFLIQLIKDKSQVAEVTPFEAYVKVLKTYLDLIKQKELKPQVIELLEQQGYKKYSYQIDAVQQVLSIINQYQGAIIADVVGLGKSVIASLVSKSLGKRGIVISPPKLMGDEKTKTSGWHKYAQDFKLYDWEIHSSGNLEAASEYLNRYGDDIEIVVIDEAHRFRNQDTLDYELLNTICKGRIVLLLTATPFNNSPADIFSLLKLFIVPGKSGITLEDNLEGRFSHYESIFKKLTFIIKNYNTDDPDKRVKAERHYELMFQELPIDITEVKQRARALADEIRNVIEPILIRRNRLDLKSDPVYKNEIENLSETENPRELFFELTKKQSAFYDTIQEEYFGEDGMFKGAIYQPFMYEQILKEDNLDEEGNRSYQQQRNLYDFMRRLLVKRFESSFGSFRQSISNFIRVQEAVKTFIHRSGRYILDRDIIEKVYNGSSDEIEQALIEFAENLDTKKNPKHEKIYTIDEFELKDDFLKDVDSDITLLHQIKEQIDELNLATDDPKAFRVMEEIDKILNEHPKEGEPVRKVIVFSEYVDTVHHLRTFFKKRFGDKLLIVDGKLGKKKNKDLLENFDASNDVQKNKYQVLLTSDVLSEGQNLNRAGAIINYDIPWNPTRVIQRVGRINRIGAKVFNYLRIYNFFPTEQGADIVKSRQIASNKMYLIHNTLGEDVKIFDVDEEPTPSELFKRVNRNPEDDGEISHLTEIRLRYEAISKSHPDIIDRVHDLPLRIKTAKASEQNELLVFRKKGMSMFINHVHDMGSEKPDIDTIYSLVDVLKNIECEPDTVRLELSSDFWKAYREVKKNKTGYTVSQSEISYEVKALNVLKTALYGFKEQFKDQIEFIRTLVRDLTDYKSLPKYTLRRIGSVELSNENPESIPELKGELLYIKQLYGADYLDRLRDRTLNMKNDIIIGVENIKD